MTDAQVTDLAGVLIWTTTERHAAMATFYRDTVGLAARSDRKGFINFEWGSTRLTISVHSEIQGPASDPLRMMVNLETPDILAAAAALRSRGVHFTREPSQEPWGGWIATFNDPDGNTVQLMQLDQG